MFKQKGINFGAGSGGMYSTKGGKVMSGTKAGYGEFGQTDTEIGEIDPVTGKQRIYTAFGGSTAGMATPRSVDTTPANMPDVTVTPKTKLSKESELRRVKGKALTNRQKKRLGKGGAKAERQEARIRNKARRQRDREARRGR